MYTEPAIPESSGPVQAPAHVLARKVWAAFAFTFVLSRILVFLIMSGRLPDIHSHFRGTHLHHLNYGIVLLAGVGAVLLFNRPTGRWLSATAILYGVGLALTDRKSTRLNSSHSQISYAVFCLKKKND